jgi:predicted  nucleic acid-binding Zn-ribbon protein
LHVVKPLSINKVDIRGCVHCVWDIYREDIEHWQNARQRARDALKAKKRRIPAWLGGKAAQKEELDPLAEIDPGLRAFMELEKRLKEKREAREQAL